MTLTQGAVPQWRDISTAPKDGTRVLLANPGDPVASGFWNARFGTWDDGDFHDDLGEFAFWMPLPLPPEQP